MKNYLLLFVFIIPFAVFFEYNKSNEASENFSSIIESNSHNLNSKDPSLYIPTIELNVKKGFPALFGEGADAITGGRGGIKFFITSLSNSDVATFVSANGDSEAHYEGTLRGAFTLNEPIHIIPRVSGNIDGGAGTLNGSEIYRDGAFGGLDLNITYHGHLAPLGGLAFINGRFRIARANNIIFRYLTTGIGSNITDGDHDNIYFNRCSRIALDHISLRYHGDESLDLGVGKEGSTFDDIIVQRSIMGQGHEDHNRGTLLGATEPGHSATIKVTFHNNFWVTFARTPNAAGNNQNTAVRAYNGVIYNWQGRTTNIKRTATFDEINRYYKAGPATWDLSRGVFNQFQSTGEGRPSIYTYGNVVENYLTTVRDNRNDLWSKFIRSGVDNSSLPNTDFRNNPLPVDPEVGYVPKSAVDGKVSVIDDAEVGNNRAVDQNGNTVRYHDAIDQNYINAFKTSGNPNTPRTNWSHPQRASSLPYSDSDWNGISDSFEAMHGISNSDEVILNWDFGFFRVVNNAGYDAFEIWSAYAAGDFDLLERTGTDIEPKEIWLEAECANIGTNWNMINDTDASSGRHVEPPVGNFYNTPPVNPDSFVSFNFSAPAGNYKLYARVKVPSTEDDSFYIRVNGGEWIRWNAIPGGDFFSWHQVHRNENINEFITFDLINGSNNVDVAHREDGASLDKLYLTNTSNIPSGLVREDLDCSGNPITANMAARATTTTEVDSKPRQLGNDFDNDVVHLYPNPTTNTVKISGIKGKSVISMMDSAGRIIFNKKSFSSDPVLDVSAYSPGTYYIKVVGDFETSTFQIVKK